MRITQEFIEGVREDICQKKELWNPDLLLETEWEFVIPLDAGVSVTVFAHVSGDKYNLNSHINTVGDAEVEESVVRQLLEEVIETNLPVAEVNYMEGLDGFSTVFTVKFDSLTDATTQVDVELPWGDDPIVVNVPEGIEDKEKYAEDAVNTLVRTDLRKAVSEVSVDPLEVSPSAVE
jgi:hypothetical protein